MLKKMFGDRRFYRAVFALMVPILIQNGITNFVNMLDNLMIGQVGQVDLIGVSVTNQVFFVFNLCIFGAVSGAGIFGAQYFGSGNVVGLRDSYRLKIVATMVLTAAALVLFVTCGDKLIMLYLKGEGTAEDVAASLLAGRRYMNVMLVGLLPMALAQCYASTLRETGKTMPPMVAGIAAVLVNLVLNYILIFGHLGLPAMGVVGAAIATVVSRFVELGVVAMWTARHSEECPFIIGAYKSLRVPIKLVKQFLIRGTPLIINETMWASSIAIINQSYSVRGLDVVAANSVLNTFYNVFNVALLAVAASIGIMLGQLLGAGKKEEAEDSSTKLIIFSVIVAIVVASLFAACSGFIPNLYNLEPEVKSMATSFILICAAITPVDALASSCYFTLRSGGKTLLTLLMDSGFAWAINVPAAVVLCHFTSLNILAVYAICSALHILKALFGIVLVRRKTWLQNIVA